MLKKVLSFLVVFIMFFSITGCGADKAGNDLAIGEENNGILTESSRKVYYIVNLDVESEDINKSINYFTNEATRLNGYISSSNINENESGTITFRIPTEKLNDFLTIISNSEDSTVNNKQITSTDVTTSYNEIDARLEILYASRKSYLNLLENTNSLSDIIMIKTRIEEIDSEILRLEKEKGSYDNLIEYSTINMNIYSKGNGFFSNYLSYLLGFITVIGVLILYLLPVAIITVIIVIVVKKTKKTKEKQEK